MTVCDPDRVSVGDRIGWDSVALGRCAGRVVGVHELGVTARRDEVLDDRTKPHFIEYGKFFRLYQGDDTCQGE